MKKLLPILLIFATQSSFGEVFLADPSIMLEGDTYYLIGTMDLNGDKNPFEIYTSKDLLNWTNKNTQGKVNFALQDGKCFAGKRFVAPQMFKYKGKFYFGYSEYRLAFAKSDKVLGPYSQEKPAAIEADSKQIDSFVLPDDDGKIYVYFSYDRGGNDIYVAEINEDFNRLKNLKLCITVESAWEDMNENGAKTIEGPTVLKRGGKYVLFYSANDFRNPMYAVGYAVSDTPTGPWVRAKNNPILSKDITGANGSGHGDVFVDKDGKLWYVFHTHNSNSQIAPRRTAIIELKESFIGGVPFYEAVKETFRYL